LTSLEQLLDQHSLDRLAEHLQVIEQAPPTFLVVGPSPTPPPIPVESVDDFLRSFRPVPTRRCASAGGRATAIKRKLQKIRRLTDEIETLRASK
jgi:hypothetical protein